MVFEELIELEVKEQIDYLNRKLDERLTVSKIREVLGIGEKKLQKHLKSINYKFDPKSKNYIVVTEVAEGLEKVKNYKDNHLVVKGNAKPVGTKSEANTLPVEFTDYDKLINMVNTYQEMSKKMEQMDEMLQWYEMQKSVIDITPPKLEIPPSNEEVISRSFKVEADIYNDFSEFCKKNNNYKVQQIISHALREFLNKYNK